MNLAQLISELEAMAASVVTGAAIDFKRFLDLAYSFFAQEYVVLYRALAPDMPPRVRDGGKVYEWRNVRTEPELAWYLVILAKTQPEVLKKAVDNIVAQRRFGFDAYMQNNGINQLDPITITALIALVGALVTILIKVGPQVYDWVASHAQDVFNLIHPPTPSTDPSTGGGTSPTTPSGSAAPKEPSWTIWEVVAVGGAAFLLMETDVLHDMMEALGLD